MPARTSELSVCFGCAWVRNTALERKWSPPISGWRDRFGAAHVGVADDGQVLAERLERAERARREVERRARSRPATRGAGFAPHSLLPGRAVHHLDADQPRAIERRGRAPSSTRAPRAGTIASRNGSATVAPRPRSMVRRGTCFPVMNAIWFSAPVIADLTAFAVVLRRSRTVNATSLQLRSRAARPSRLRPRPSSGTPALLTIATTNAESV